MKKLNLKLKKITPLNSGPETNTDALLKAFNRLSAKLDEVIDELDKKQNK